MPFTSALLPCAVMGVRCKYGFFVACDAEKTPLCVSASMGLLLVPQVSQVEILEGGA